MSILSRGMQCKGCERDCLVAKRTRSLLLFFFSFFLHQHGLAQAGFVIHGFNGSAFLVVFMVLYSLCVSISTARLSRKFQAARYHLLVESSSTVSKLLGDLLVPRMEHVPAFHISPH